MGDFSWIFNQKNFISIKSSHKRTDLKFGNWSVLLWSENLLFCNEYFKWITWKRYVFIYSLTWKTVSRAFRTLSKLDVGVSIGKLKDPPKSCIPSNANIKMKRKSKNRRDIIDDKAFMRAITRFRKGDQYLKFKKCVC